MAKLPHKMKICGAAYRKYEAAKGSDPYRACRAVKFANKRGCKWSKKSAVVKSCKRKY